MKRMRWLWSGVFLISWMMACGGEPPEDENEDEDDGGTGAGAGDSTSGPTSSGTGESSSGSGMGENRCSAEEVGLIGSCAPLYEQQEYPLCTAIAACLQNDLMGYISEGCRICTANTIAVCDTSSGALACSCCD